MGESETGTGALVERFTREAERIGAQVHRVPDHAAAARQLAAIARAAELAAVLLAPSLNPAWASRLHHAAPDLPVRHPAETPDVREVYAREGDRALGVSEADLAVTETGTVVLARHDLRDRLTGMLAIVHAVIVPVGCLVAGLDEAGACLDRWQRQEGRRYVSFVTGPSRTADIERVLTIGVQGPRALHLLLLDADGTEREEE